MPYFVFAIHTDSGLNRLLGSPVDLEEASILEKRMQAGNYPGDNYFVRMINAEDIEDAHQQIRAIRLKQNLPLSDK